MRCTFRELSLNPLSILQAETSIEHSHIQTHLCITLQFMYFMQITHKHGAIMVMQKLWSLKEM
jgi:hypothetical protein